MKTFNLTIATLAIVAAASTSAFATEFDSNGNIPNHHSEGITGYNDSVDTFNGNSSMFVDRSSNGSGLSANDALILKLRTDADQDARGRS